MSATMIKSGKFIPLSELRRLMTGSLESRAERVREAVIEGARHFVGDVPVEVVSTFEDRAVIFAADLFHSVAFTETDDGKLFVTGAAPLSVEMYDEAEKDKYLVKEARTVVDLFFQGSSARAFVLAGQLAELVDSDPRRADARKVQVVETVLSLDRPWRRVLNERKPSFEKLGSSWPTLDKNKYAKLLDEGVNAAGYSKAVESDLETVQTRIDNLEAKLDECVTQTAGVESDSIKYAREFAVDLLADLRTLKEHTSRAAEGLSLVEYRGKLRDVLAGALPDYQLAVGFVEQMACRLGQNQ